jgi:hypothetical protein
MCISIGSPTLMNKIKILKLLPGYPDLSHHLAIYCENLICVDALDYIGTVAR